MKYLILALALFSAGTAATEVKVSQNNRVTVRENGITKEYGTVRKIETDRVSGKTKIYTDRNFSGPAVTVDRNKDIKTQRANNDEYKYCNYNCSVEMYDEQ